MRLSSLQKGYAISSKESTWKNSQEGKIRSSHHLTNGCYFYPVRGAYKAPSRHCSADTKLDGRAKILSSHHVNRLARPCQNTRLKRSAKGAQDKTAEGAYKALNNLFWNFKRQPITQSTNGNEERQPIIVEIFHKNQRIPRTTKSSPHPITL